MKYAYKVIRIHAVNGDLEKTLIALGEEGWQLFWIQRPFQGLGQLLIFGKLILEP